MTTLLLSLVLTLAPPSPQLVRVAIVDNSPSMAGARIATVRAELSKVIRQLPPSDQFPLVLLVFHGNVEPTQVFTDMAVAEKAVAALSGNGTGTRIAPALLKAHDELKRFQQVTNVMVLLYSDGEDNDQESVRRAEVQLDTLFAERTKQGLMQSLFVKRWGNANATLVHRLQTGGHIHVLDGGELSIDILTVEPNIIVHEARRDPQDPRRLHVRYTPSLTIRGHFPDAIRAQVRFECRNPKVSGQSIVDISPTAGPASYQLALPIPTDAERARTLTLAFQVTPSAPTPKSNHYVLPLIPQSVVMVPVPLPPIDLKNIIAAEVRSFRAVNWHDPARQRVRCEAELALHVKAAESGSLTERSMVLRVTTPAGDHLLSPQNPIHLPGLGSHPVKLLLDLPLATDSAPGAVHTVPLAIQLTTTPNSPSLTIDPPVLLVKQPGIAVPAPQTTVIIPEVQRIGRAVWVDVVDCVAAFDADVLFRVQGPLPHQAVLTLVSPGNIRQPVLPAGTQLHTGEAIVPLHVVARLSPGKIERLDFTVVPPSPTPALHCRVESGFSLSVFAPPRVGVAHGDRRGPQPSIHAVLPDNRESFDVELVPILVGVQPATLRRLPRIDVEYTGTQATVRSVTTEVGRPLQLRVTLAPLAGRSFFRDVDERLALILRPHESTTAVVPGQVSLIVHRQAPFKRLLAYLSWAAFPLGLLLLAVRVLRHIY